MRADARSLLDRLGRSDFAYKEFADRFSDLELWPLFEALLKDPRLFQQEQAAAVGETFVAPAAVPVMTPGIAGARPAGPSERAAPQTPSTATATATAAPGKESLADLFSRYEAGSGTAPPRQGHGPSQGQDVRAMLRRLSDLDAQGKL